MGTSESTMGMSRLASPILQDEPAKLSIKEQLAAANIEIPYIKGENPYERDRRERMARNAYVMANMGIKDQANKLYDNHLDKKPVIRKVAQRRNSIPVEDAPRRRSERQIGVKRDYMEIGPRYDIVERDIRAKLNTRGATGRTKMVRIREVFPVQSLEAQERAEDAASEKAAENESGRAFSKKMLWSNVAGGYWQQLPSAMQERWPFREKAFIEMECSDVSKMPDAGWCFQKGENERRWPTVWLPRPGSKNRQGCPTTAGLSGGWRGFAIDQMLTPNDTVVWEIPADVPFGSLPKYLIVHLFRGEDYETDASRKFVVTEDMQREQRAALGEEEKPELKAVEGSEEGVSVEVAEVEATVEAALALAAIAEGEEAGKEEAKAEAAPVAADGNKTATAARKTRGGKAAAASAAAAPKAEEAAPAEAEKPKTRARAAPAAKKAAKKRAVAAASPGGRLDAEAAADAAVVVTVQPKGGAARQRKPSAIAAAVQQAEWEAEQKRLDKLAAEGLATEEDFDVEIIMDATNISSATPLFLVRWVGYTAEHDTWEPYSMFDFNMFAYPWADKKLKEKARKHAKKWKK